jgi:hypothetical protein
VTPVLDAVRRLSALTEDQIGAARTLKGDALAQLNERRADALFDLRLALATHGLPEADEVVREEVRRLATAEKRLSSIANAVLGRIAILDSGAPAPTYDRAGRMG